jgi:hypothetical protein
MSEYCAYLISPMRISCVFQFADVFIQLATAPTLKHPILAIQVAPARAYQFK